MENNNIEILRDKLLESFYDQYKANLLKLLKYSRQSTIKDAYYELSRTEVLFLSFLEALWSENVELSLRFLNEIDKRKLFPRITFYMGGKLHAEFDLPTELLEKALEFASSLKESRLADVPDYVMHYLGFLVKRWKGILPKGERLVSVDETFNVSEPMKVSQVLDPQNNSVSSTNKDNLRSRSKRHSKKPRASGSQTTQVATQQTTNADVPLPIPATETNSFKLQSSLFPKIDQEFILDPIANALVTSTSLCSRVAQKEKLRTKEVTRDLFFAIGRNDPVATQLAIHNGADLEERGVDGFAPLHIAARGGCERIVSILIQSGADLNSRNRTGCTPLHLAVVNGNEKVVILLVKSHALLDVKDNYGITPLHDAAARGHLKIVQLLVTNGAPINSKANCGETPLATALLWNQQSTAAFLSQMGGAK